MKKLKQPPMAKEDFCFTYYDGDACRDMSHMNRLERGAYNDLVLQQRKFGRLSLEQIKKVLGKDFEEVWPSVNLVLVFDGERYFIQWLETSIEKMRSHAKKQSGNRKGKTKNNQTGTKQEPEQNQTKPLEDGDGNEDGNELKNKKESTIEGDGFTYEFLESAVKVIEEKLLELDEIYLNNQATKWPHLDFDYEYRTFCEKVRGSPEFYKDHRDGGIRLAFQKQLRDSPRRKQNGLNQTTGRKQQHTANLAASVTETYRSVFTGGGNGEGGKPTT